MSNFSFPERPVAEIITVLSEAGIANLRPEDLSNPTFEVVCSIYSNFLTYVDPLGFDDSGQIGFDALELLDNPDHHVDAIRVFNLYRKINDMLASIRYVDFSLRDVMKPDARRTVHILSTIVNYIFYREEKLNMLQPKVDPLPGFEAKRLELEPKIAELYKEIDDHELARQSEEPRAQELDAEVKQLKQSIQNYNRQQMSLKTTANGLKDKINAIKDKISQADFELVKNAQENSNLLSKVVQSPDKLQRTVEEKKANQTEVKNLEKLATQSVQKKTATLEVYLKAYDKTSKLFSQMQAMQEQVNSAKGVDKDVKANKAKLSEEAVLNISLDAKINEWQGKDNQGEELVKASEKERDTRHQQETQRLDNLRTEIEWKLQNLEPREKAVEAMVAKGDSLCLKAGSTREVGKATEHQLQAKLEAIVDVFYSYSNMIDGTLQSHEANMASEPAPLRITN